MAYKTKRLVLPLFLILLAFVNVSSGLPPKKASKPHQFRTFSVQSPSKWNEMPKIYEKNRRSDGWSIPVAKVIDGALISDVKHKRAVYEASEAELYLIATPNSETMSKVECLQGGGWFYSVPSTPKTQVCLPWSEWSNAELRFSIRRAYAGEAVCSHPFTLEQYPQCGLGYHCSPNQGKCVLTKSYKTEQAGTCPAESGLVWSRTKGRCVQCLASNLRYPSYTVRPMPSDYYRLGFVCDSDGNAVPPLAVEMAFQLYTEPSSFLFMGIFIIIVISTALHLSLFCHNKETKYRKHHDSS